jgi:hypothetical protein
LSHVRFAPESRHCTASLGCPLSAIADIAALFYHLIRTPD